MIYCYPRLSDRDYLLFRFLGPGLGNLLFPWARALVHARRHGQQVIAPTWPQIKIGTLLRRETDTRMYTDLFGNLPGALAGRKRVVKLLGARRVNEVDSESARDGDVIEFRGMDGMFSSMLHDFEFVRQSLVEMTCEEHLSGLQYAFSDSVSLHVRLGDFARPKSVQQLGAGQRNTRIPLTWYRDILEGLRQKEGRCLQAYVFSDGRDEELELLLRMPNCKRIGFGSAIADMLALSRANILVASGSTFSMWASYLGRMPIIWHPGQLKQKLYTDDTPEIEIASIEEWAAARTSRQ